MGGIRREGRAGRAGGRADERAGTIAAREWWSPPGDGLYISVLLRPPIALAQAQRVTMLVSLAAIEACENVAGVSPQPKWPNDLLWQGRKLAGVLTEIRATDDRLDYAIVGLGLNVNNRFADSALAETAISLGEAGGRTVAVDDLAVAYVAALQRRYQRFLAGESPLAEWRAHLWPLGQRVIVQRRRGRNRGDGRRCQPGRGAVAAR